MTGALLLFLHAVCPLLFFTDVTRNPYAAQIYLLQGGLLLAVLLEAGAAVRRGAFVRRATFLDVPLGAWALVALSSWGLSWLAHPALRPSILAEGFRNHFFLFTNLLLPFCLAARADSLLDARVRRTVLAVGALASIYGLLQYAGVEWVWDKALNPYNGRPVSTFGNPNFLSSYVVMLTPLALWEFSAARPAARSGWGFLILVYGAALISTMTRSSWIGAAAAVAVFAALVRPRGERLKSLAFLGAALAAAALFWPGSPLADRRESPLAHVAELVRGVTGKQVYGSWHQRLLIWSCAWDMWRERPFFGKGWGCFELFYPFYQGARLLNPLFQGFRTHANNAHNVLMEVGSQTGLAGAGVAAWIVVSGAVFFRRRAPALPEDRRALACAKAAALAGMLADNFFGNVSLFFAVPGFLFAWTAGSLAADLADGGERETSLRRPAALAAALLVAAAAAGGIAWCFRAWRAEVDYFEGYKRARREDLAGAARSLESSRRWRRYEVNNAYELANVYLRQARGALASGLTDVPHALLEKAVGAYDDALAANAGYDEIHFNEASALLQLGRTGEAVRQLRLSLLINPLHQEGYRLLGSLYAQGAGDPAAEEDLFVRATRAFPADKEFWNGLGHARARAGRPADAAEAFARALSLDADFKGAEGNLRAVLARAGLPPPPVLAAPGLAARVRDLARGRRWAEARVQAEALAVLTPGWTTAWLMAADLRMEAGAPEEALAAYDRVLSLEPGHHAARLNKARALLALNRRPAARALLGDVSRDFPDDAEAKALLGKL